MTVTLESIKTMEGEATANNRKAKLIFLFEWEIKISIIGLFSYWFLFLVRLFALFWRIIFHSWLIVMDEKNGIKVNCTYEVFSQFGYYILFQYLGRVSGSDVEYKGTIEIPNLSDENEADEVDVSYAPSELLKIRQTSGLEFCIFPLAKGWVYSLWWLFQVNLSLDTKGPHEAQVRQLINKKGTKQIQVRFLSR